MISADSFPLYLGAEGRWRRQNASVTSKAISLATTDVRQRRLW